MNKEQYLKDLRKKLRRLPKTEFDKAMAYFEEYFEDAGPEREQQAITDLGTPEEAAYQIIQNIAIENTKEPIHDMKKGMNALWVAILAVFAAPIALPLLIMASALIFILLCLAAGILVLLIACGIMIIVMGPISVGAGFSILTTSIPAALICFGQGFAEIGIGLLLIRGIYFLSRKYINWIILFFGKMIKKGGKKNA